MLIQEVRRQQAGAMARQQEQDTDVEQVAAPAQLSVAQKLRRVALPGVLIAVETDQAARQENRQADIRVVAEQELVDEVHALAPGAGGVLRTIWIGWGWPGLAWPRLLQPSNTTGSAQLSSI